MNNEMPIYNPALHHVKRAPKGTKIRVGSYLATFGAWDRKYQVTAIAYRGDVLCLTVRFLGRYFAKKALRNTRERVYNQSYGRWEPKFKMLDYVAPVNTQLRTIVEIYPVKQLPASYPRVGNPRRDYRCSNSMVHVIPA